MSDMTYITKKWEFTYAFIDGLTYAGVGWAIWRDKSFLPDEILFTVNYLGSPQVSFTLNFSKSGAHVIGQYYQFLRMGKSGYRNVVSVACLCWR